MSAPLRSGRPHKQTIRLVHYRWLLPADCDRIPENTDMSERIRSMGPIPVEHNLPLRQRWGVPQT